MDIEIVKIGGYYIAHKKFALKPSEPKETELESLQDLLEVATQHKLRLANFIEELKMHINATIEKGDDK